MTTFFEDTEEAALAPRLPQAGLRTALSVAGLDPSGGAGVIADVRTFDALDVYGMAAVSTITYQNTSGVIGRFDLPAEALLSQVEAIFADRMPNAIKTGALGSADSVRELGLLLAKKYTGPVVVDPVVLSAGGQRLLDEDAVSALERFLLPVAAMVTPNIKEVELLSGFAVFDSKDAEAAALRLVAAGARSALITGLKSVEAGEDVSADVFCDGEEIEIFTNPWVEGLEVHGSGCLLSAGIAACLARGMSLKDAVVEARALTRAAIEVPVFPGRGAACADPFMLKKARSRAPEEIESEAR
ncbi:MAG TPA: bifunctional hydroxymethylpyrimidine kinase/phosphomethylpyrimidine kinase [Candidatus Anoxymicrobiaceae bacterium]